MSFVPQIFQFAYFKEYDRSIEYLAESLAAKEDWDFHLNSSQTSSAKTYAILKNYLEFTYRKLLQEGKIAYTASNDYACFNTGLVTQHWEDIYAFFERNKYLKPGFSPYYFKNFLKKSNRELITAFPSTLPDVANFFEKPELLLFNPKSELIPDIDHIIEDNIERFPLHLQNADDAELRRQLFGAIDEVKKKVRTNYKIAIPQYYNGHIQLLLPLCLTSGSPNPDLALVVYKLNETTYTARTCLTLRMAYQNARLIVKPQSDWLKP